MTGTRYSICTGMYGLDMMLIILLCMYTELLYFEPPGKHAHILRAMCLEFTNLNGSSVVSLKSSRKASRQPGNIPPIPAWDLQSVWTFKAPERMDHTPTMLGYFAGPRS